ncbi:hypothetical protein [Moraxella porci]|uniref:hypothetical protein n=1 Tax=Moraxella porci TaxID=1288392 RepID=UPI00244A8F21|nr:hypothetical protein [Moraxella porci]MDH2273353.1 hypothetical protein [Moraxella porci]
MLVIQKQAIGIIAQLPLYANHCQSKPSCKQGFIQSKPHSAMIHLANKPSKIIRWAWYGLCKN